MKTKVQSNLPFTLLGLLPIGGDPNKPTNMEFSWSSQEVMTLTNLGISINGAATLGSNKVEVRKLKNKQPL